MTETATAEQAPFAIGEEVLASPSRNYTPRPAVVVSCVEHARLSGLWLLTFRIVDTGAEHTVQTTSRDYLATNEVGSPTATVIAPVRPATTPELEAKRSAIAAGVEAGDITPHGPGLTSAWLVIGGTRTASPYVALVSSDEVRAWDVARDHVRISRGVRVERHPFI